MKRVSLFVIFAVVTAVCAQAQIFVGGSMGLGFESISRTVGSSASSTKQPSTFVVMLNPMAGFELSETMAIGLSATFGIGVVNHHHDPETKDYSYLWGAAPFMRNNLASTEKLSLKLQSAVGVTGSSIIRSQGRNVTDGPREFQFSIILTPVLSYNFTDRLGLEAVPNILSLGFTALTEKTDSTPDATVTNTNRFGMGVNMAPMRMGTALQIGLIYKL